MTALEQSMLIHIENGQREKTDEKEMSDTKRRESERDRERK